MLIAGALLFLLGALYMLWAVNRLPGTRAAEEPAAFDRPIAGLARLVRAQQERLDRVQPMTQVERALAGALLFLLGALYMLGAVNRLHGTPAAEETAAFDRRPACRA